MAPGAIASSRPPCRVSASASKWAYALASRISSSVALEAAMVGGLPLKIPHLRHSLFLDQRRRTAPRRSSGVCVEGLDVRGAIGPQPVEELQRGHAAGKGGIEPAAPNHPRAAMHFLPAGHLTQPQAAGRHDPSNEQKD